MYVHLSDVNLFGVQRERGQRDSDHLNSWHFGISDAIVQSLLIDYSCALRKAFLHSFSPTIKGFGYHPVGCATNVFLPEGVYASPCPAPSSIPGK